MATHPTYVVGVGQAGIKVMNNLAEVAEENNDRDKFRFVALDTDSDTLNTRPPQAYEVKINHNSAFENEDKGKYPYLTKEFVDNLNDEGAMRRRSIGRYKLDSRGGSDSFSEVFDTLWTLAEDHYDEWATDINTDQASFNIFYIHSMGGGTGSGTYPLLTVMLNALSDKLQNKKNNLSTYLAGVGVVPRITFDPDIYEPDGDPRFFPNTYAAISDLNKFEELESLEENRSLKSYAMTYGSANMDSNAPGESEFDLNSPPFDDYWLFGVNEDKIQGAVGGTTGKESYRKRINQTIARSLHSITQLGESAENWADAKPYVGSFDQSEVRVPHEEVLEYYDKQSEREQKQTRIEDEIPTEIEDLEQRQDDLQTLKENVDENAVSDPELRETVRNRIESEFPSGANLVENKTIDDIERILDEIQADHNLEGTAIATTILQSKLREERGLPKVKEDRKDTITDLWSKYDMSTKPRFGGEAVSTIEGKATGTQEFLHSKIDEYTDIVENWEPGLIGQIQVALPPVGPFESDKEQAERILEDLRDARDDLERVQQEWGRVSDMRQAVDDRRREIRERIDDRMSDISEQITDLQTERDDLEREIARIDDDIDGIRSSLSNEQTSQRLVILPIETENLDSIDPENAADILTSIDKYEQKDLIETKLLRNAVGQSVDYCDAGDRREVITQEMNTDEHRTPEHSETNETWLLYHEDNEDFRQEINTQIGGATRTAGDEQLLGYLSDPYRIEFISYCRRGPIPSFVLYKDLREMAEKGTLDGYAGQYSGEHRLAFAYLEWYGRDIKEVFKVSERVEVEKPPEMDHTRVDKPGRSEGEIKNEVRTHMLDSYLWNGAMMDDYDDSNTNTFTGWDEKLSANAVSWNEFQQSTPSVDLKKQWLQGNAEWQDILGAYVDNLFEETGGIKLVFKSE